MEAKFRERERETKQSKKEGREENSTDREMHTRREERAREVSFGGNTIRRRRRRRGGGRGGGGGVWVGGSTATAIVRVGGDREKVHDSTT
jgi:hypothetical protein